MDESDFSIAIAKTRAHSKRSGVVTKALWNFLGQSIPMAVAVFAIPLLLQGIGTDRFGILSLAWVAVGYFSLFDLGLGRALTLLAAKQNAIGDTERLSGLVWTALLAMFLLGIVAAAVAGLLSPWLVQSALKIPASLQTEALGSFYLLSLGIPVVIVSGGLRGLLEAQLRFNVTNAVRIPMAALAFLAPLAVLPFSKSIFPIIAILVLIRLAGLIALLFFCFYFTPSLRCIRIDLSMIRELLAFGGWMTVSNIISPLLVSADRFLIGAMVSVEALAYYSTPQELVTKMWIIPAALVGVLFPVFSSDISLDPSAVKRLFVRSLKFIFLAVFPITLGVICFAHQGLQWWLGPEFAQHSYVVLQWLAFGLFFSCLAQVPFTLIQAAGKPQITAALHLISLPLYALAFFWLVRNYGILGAAIAWAGRMVLDALATFLIALRLLPSSGPIRWRWVVIFGFATMVEALFFVPMASPTKISTMILALIAFFIVSWSQICGPDERALMRTALRRETQH